MQIIGGINYDPSKGKKSFSASVAGRGGVVILHNLSPIELLITFNSDMTRQIILLAWAQRKVDFCGVQTDTIGYEPLPGVPLPVQQLNVPSSVIWGEAYAPGEPVPESFPNYDRLSNIGNQGVLVGNTQFLDNENNVPGAGLIRSIPTGAAQPSVIFDNTGAGQWTIFSLGQLINFLTLIQGSNSQHAQVVIGDAADPSMLVMHGQADSAAQAGQAQTAVQANSAMQMLLFDGSLSVQRQINQYEGTVDPQTYLTPAIGDMWFEG